MLEALALLPAAAALLVLARGPRRGGLLAFAGLLAALALLLSGHRLAVTERVVLVLDTVDARPVPHALVHAEGLAIRACRGLALQGPTIRESPADPSEWMNDCSRLQRESLPVVPDPKAALDRARAWFAGRPLPVKALDLLLQRSLRVVFVLENPARWKGASWTVDAAEEIQQARQQGIRVDLLTGENAAAQAPPALHIVPLNAYLPMFGSSDRDFSFALEISGLEGAQSVGSIERRCVLGGTCFDSADCPAGLTCHQNACRKECLQGSESPCGDGLVCRQSHCVPPQADPAWLLTSATAPVAVTTRDGAPVLRSREPIPLSAFRGGTLSRERGWHALTCEVSIPSTGAGERHLPLRATTYLQAREGQMYVVWGNANRFNLADATLPSLVRRRLLPDLSADALWGGRPNHYRAVGFADDLFEEDLRSDVSDTRCDGDAGGKRDLRCLKPSVLLVHDATPRFFQAYCPWLSEMVRDRGMTLVVSGVPPEPAQCKDFPVYAATTGDAAATTILHDRRPQVTFVLDPSRIGRLMLKPSPDASPLRSRRALASATLADGWEAQLDVVAEVVKHLPGGQVPPWQFDKARLTLSRAGGGPTFLTLGPPSRDPAVAITRRDGAASMARESSVLKRLDGELFKVPPPEERLGVEDVVVVFAYDVKQPGFQGRSPIPELLSRGVRIVVVPIRTPPYEAAVTRGTELRALLATEASTPGSGPFRGQAATRSRLMEVAQGRVVPFGAAATAIALDSFPEALEGQKKEIAGALEAFLRQRADPGDMQVGISSLQRFVDERLLPAGAVESDTAPARAPGGAPLLYQQLQLRRAASALDSYSPVRALAMMDAEGPTRLDPMTLGVWSIQGRGHALYLGYSIFEGGMGDFAFRDIDWTHDAGSRLYVPGVFSRWGAERVIEAGGFTADLEALPGPAPRIRRITRTGASFIRFEVQQQLQERNILDALYARRLRSSLELAPAGSCQDKGRAGAVPLRLTDLSPSTHSSIYELSPRLLDDLCGAAPCEIRLCREVWNGENLKVEEAKEDNVFLSGPPRGQAALETDDLPVLAQLRVLAQYTGGEKGLQLAGAQVAPRFPAAVAAAATLGLLWLVGGARRLALRRRHAREDQLRVEASLEEVVQGTVYQLGESLGHPVAGAPAGSFAGYRPFDPGDRLKAAVGTDVVIMSGTVQENLSVAPRIVQRIDERARRVRLAVNVGKSMRIPGRGARASKLIAAGRAGDLLAEMTWAARGEIVLQPFGLRGTAEASEPQRGPFGTDGVRGWATSEVFTRDAGWPRTVDLEEVEGGESVLLISDLLNEDLELLSRQLETVEADGGSAGVVHVYSERERGLLELGYHGGSRLLFDRATWTPGDVQAAQLRLRDEVERRFGDLRGGAVTIAAELTAEQILTTLRDSTIADLLK